MAEERNKYEPRFYRDRMGEGRFLSFVVGYKDSDLWIGIDKESYSDDIPEFARQKLVELRNQLEDYIGHEPLFGSSFEPVSALQNAPSIAKQMAEAASIANVGPMAAVAGIFSERIGKAILREFALKEIVVENGGDIFLSLQRDLVLSVYAGNSPLSGKIGVEISALDTPLGICTSAGTVGPSVSFGKADAVMVACLNTALADAYATAIGNQVKSAHDMEAQLAMCDKETAILSLLIVCEGKVGLKGKYPLKIIA